MKEKSYKSLDYQKTRLNMSLLNEKNKETLFGEVTLPEFTFDEDEVKTIVLNDCSSEEEFDVKKFLNSGYKDVKNIVLADEDSFVLHITDVIFKEFLVSVGDDVDSIEQITVQGKIQIINEDNDFKHYKKYSV